MGRTCNALKSFSGNKSREGHRCVCEMIDFALSLEKKALNLEIVENWPVWRVCEVSVFFSVCRAKMCDVDGDVKGSSGFLRCW